MEREKLRFDPVVPFWNDVGLGVPLPPSHKILVFLSIDEISRKLSEVNGLQVKSYQIRT